MSYERELEAHCGKLESELESLSSEVGDIVQTMALWRYSILHNTFCTIDVVPKDGSSAVNGRLKRIFTVQSFPNSVDQTKRQFVDVICPIDILDGCDKWTYYVDCTYIGNFQISIDVKYDTERKYDLGIQKIAKDVYMGFHQWCKEYKIGYVLMDQLLEKYGKR